MATAWTVQTPLPYTMLAMLMMIATPKEWCIYQSKFVMEQVLPWWSRHHYYPRESYYFHGSGDMHADYFVQWYHVSCITSLEDNCGKFSRTKLIFFVTPAGGLVLCVPGQYRVFPPLAAIIAASRRGILATRRWRRCTGICAHLSSRAWRSSSRFWGGLSIELIARPNSSQRCSMG